MCSGTTGAGCDRMSSTYSYKLLVLELLVSFMFCVLVASNGVSMVMQSLWTIWAILPSP